MSRFTGDGRIGWMGRPVVLASVASTTVSGGSAALAPIQ